MNKIINTFFTLVLLATICSAQNTEKDIERAKMYERAGDFESALIYFKKLGESYPNHSKIQQGMIRNYKRLGMTLELELFLEKLVEKNPSSTKHMFEYLEILLQKNKMIVSKSIVDRIIDLAPDQAGSYKKTGTILVKYNKLSFAMAVYEKGRKKLNNGNLFIDEVGQLLMMNKNYELAIMEYFKILHKYNNKEYEILLDRLIEFEVNEEIFTAIENSIKIKLTNLSDKDKFILHKLKKDLCLLHKKYSDAFVVHKNIDDVYKRNGALLLIFADWANNEKLYDICMQVCEYLLLKYPDKAFVPKIHYLQAQVAAKQGKYEKSLVIYQDFLKKFNKDRLVPQIHFQMGEIILTEFNNAEKARAYFEKTTRGPIKTKLTYEAYFKIAECLIAGGQVKKALKKYEYVMKMAGRNKDLLNKTEFKIAETYYLLGSFSKSEKLLKNMADRHDNFYQNDIIKLMFHLEEWEDKKMLKVFVSGILLERQSKYNEAIVIWKQMIQSGLSGIRAAEVQWNIALCYSFLKQYENSVVNYRILTEKYPYSPLVINAQLEIGDILYNHLQDYQQALKYYKSIINNFPQSPTIPKIRIIMQNLMKLM